MPTQTWAMDDAQEDAHIKDIVCVSWSGTSRRTPVLLFHAEVLVTKDGSIRTVGEHYNLAFKIVRTESRLVRGILTNHGFHEVHPNSNDFNIMWTGSHLKPYLFRSLQGFQKVNHFPRSYELTRKDRLYKNIQRMQQAHGQKHFHFIPQTFILPSEYSDFCTSFSKDKEPWIIKPVASSRGRGIYLVSNPSQISMDDNVLISRYINNPLLIDNFKFDVRLYVLVTSYDPVIIYLYEEGLARFATVKYEQSGKHIKNQFMHLTNYSVNKKSSDYVSCDDPDVEDYGNKWSMSAMLRYLRQQGMDTTLLMGQIEDLVIKTLLSVELQIATACKMFVPFKTNCFELYGFDVLIDSNLKPWLLEVNLSPSLACDSPLDLKIKASMIADMFSLIGVVCQDPLMRSLQLNRAGHDPNAKSSAERFQRPLSGSGAERRPRRRQGEVGVGEPGTAVVLPSKKKQEQQLEHGTVVLSTEEVKTLRRIQDEYERRGGFIRIFPTSDTWDLYSGFLEYKTNMNSLLATRLFPESSRRRGSASLGRLGCQSVHVVQYERKLLSLQARTHRKRRRRNRRTERGCKEAVSSAEEEGEEAEEVLSIEGGGGGGGGEKKRATSAPAPSAPQEEEQQRDKAHVVVRHFAQKDIRTSASAQASASASSHQASSHQASSAQATRRPRVNLLYVLQQGWQLSKVQARVAFSCYLQRVQSRLLSESKLNSASPWPEKDNEQMELIIRFLKRAASNLQEEIQMDLPSSQLPLQDRCHILSHQLAQFIRCYDKETQLMEQELEKSKDGHFINPSVFQDFIAKASETDLEKVLTFYTLDSRSPSVFLGTRERSSKPEQSKASNSSCSGQGEPARVSHHAKWCARPAAGVNKLQEIRDGDGKETDVARIKDAYESLQASGGLKRDTSSSSSSSATKVQPQVLHVTASSHMMQHGDTSSGQTRRDKPGDGVGVGVSATATAVSATVSKSTPLLKKANEADASTASRGQHKIISKSSNSAAATAANSGPKVGRWCAALPQSAGHLPYSYHKLTTSTYSPLIPFSNAVIGPPHQAPVFNMATIANRSAAQAITCSTLTNSSAVLQQPPPQGTGAATGSSSVTEVTNKASSSSLPTPHSTTPLYGKTTSYPTPPERPKSSTAPRQHGPGVALKDAVLSRYDQKVITSALQNLIEKQAARHSSPSASISMLTQKMANFNLANAIPKKDGVDPSQSLPKALSLHKWPMRSLYSDRNVTQTHSPRSAQDHTGRVGGPGPGTGHSEVGVGVGVGGVKSPAASALLPRDASAAPSYQLHFAIQQLQQQRRRPGQFLTQSHNRHQV